MVLTKKAYVCAKGKVISSSISIKPLFAHDLNDLCLFIGVLERSDCYGHDAPIKYVRNLSREYITGNLLSRIKEKGAPVWAHAKPCPRRWQSVTCGAMRPR